jgi:hypothetical protein
MSKSMEQRVLDTIDAKRALIVAQRGTIADILAALREIRTILACDTVEYDDIRNMEQILTAAIAKAEGQS